MIHFKKIMLLGFVILFASSALNAQKAKFKNKLVSVQKIRLPQNFIEPEKRTYNLYTKGKFSDEVETHERGIYGWKLDESSPNLKGVISIYGFSIGSSKKSSKKKTKKDKDGKVTDSWTEYTYSSSAKGKATLYIYGESNPFKYRKKDQKKSKAEEKKEEEKKELSTNKFLSAEDIEDAEESDMGEDAGLDSENLPLVNTTSLNVERDVKTSANRSATAAYKVYLEKERPKLIDFRDEFPAEAYQKAITKLNSEYGYTPVIKRFYLNTMKSDKHEEYQTWNEACTAIETLLKTFKYNKSIEANQAKFDPILEYFEGIVKSIPEGDKKGKKLKVAAYENLIKTMYYLDRHEELIELCNKNLASKMLDKPSKKMLQQAEKQLAHLQFHQMNSCHMENLDEIDADSFEVSEEEAPEEGDE